MEVTLSVAASLDLDALKDLALQSGTQSVHILQSLLLRRPLQVLD
jgi:hypothetical protein